MVIHFSPPHSLFLSLFLSSISIHVCSFLPIASTHLPPNVCCHPASPVSPISQSSLFHSSYLISPPAPCPCFFNAFLFREVGITPVCLVLCLCPDSQPECPLCLWSAVELLSAKQQSQLQCASWIETLPYKALGTVALANFFFLQNKPVSLLHTSSGETVGPLCSLFWVFAPL